MFCTNCGKKVEDTWKKCPYCGEELIEENLPEEGRSIEGNIPEGGSQKEEINDEYRIIRIVFKVLTIAALVCFFCPLYMVSCAGQEIFSVSGMDLMAGFEYMGEKMDGSIVYGMLGLFPLIGACSALRFRKKLVILKKYEKIKELFYEISAAGGTTVLVNLFFTASLEQSFQGTGADIEAAMALNVMTIISLVLLIAAGCQAFRMETGEKKGVAAAKCLGKILAGVIGCFIVAAVIIYMAGGLQADTSAQEYLTEDSEEQEGAALSELDLEDYFGKSGKQLNELGFEKDEAMEEYTALDGGVYISCTDGTVDIIMLEGTDENMPAFHGVTTGMSLLEAETALEDTYFPAGQAGEQISYMNVDTGVNIVLETSGEEITRITVTQMSQEEIDSYMQEVYIFPDSDKKYLSEDEVRSVEADMLAVGRNEIFARHGYIFGEDTYKQYFESMPWYQGTVPADQFHADEVFNDFEKKNVELIKKVEDELAGSARASEPFVGMEGTYICTSVSDGEFTGKIVVSGITDSTAEITLGALDLSYDIVTVQGQILDSNTMQADIYGYTVTLVWSDAENMTASGQGELTGMDSGVIMEITNNQSYTRPLEFNHQ